MDTTLLAKVLGVYVIVSGLFLVLRGKTVPMLLKDFFAHRAVMYLSGLILIIVGGLFVFGEVEQTWMKILGWLTLIKGAVYILMPEAFFSFAKRTSRSVLAVTGILCIAIGVTIFVIL
jgi:uncharacterized membrane protein HdeD (DUF308 family)